MWIPKAYQVNDITTLHAFMQKHSFGTLVINGNVARLPFVLRADEGEFGTLIAHTARANPLSDTLALSKEAVVIFEGPHAYISPTWYQNQQAAVPTWNHITVCVYGIPEVTHDPNSVLGALQSLVHQHESQFDKPWTLGDAPAYVDRLLPHIAAFKIRIMRIEGQYKLSQDRPSDQQGVIAALSQSSDSGEREIARIMQELRDLRLQLNTKD